MFVCCDFCVLSGRGLCDGLITRPDESYRLWCVVVCDHETSKMRRLKPATGLWKIQPQWVVTTGKQTNKQQHVHVTNIQKKNFNLSVKCRVKFDSTFRCIRSNVNLKRRVYLQCLMLVFSCTPFYILNDLELRKVYSFHVEIILNRLLELIRIIWTAKG
jgi:hypothetical protein